MENGAEECQETAGHAQVREKGPDSMWVINMKSFLKIFSPKYSFMVICVI